MIRWFADLPIERKLRVVILVPAIAVFTVAMIVHVGMNLLHLRDDLQWRPPGLPGLRVPARSTRCAWGRQGGAQGHERAARRVVGE